MADIGLVQAVTNGGATGVDSATITYGSSTSASGSAFAAAIFGLRFNAAGFLLPAGTVTDNKSNTWNRAGMGTVSGNLTSYGISAGVFYVENGAGGASHQVTIDPTGTSNHFDATLFELSNAATSSLLGGTAAAGSGTGQSTAPATGSLSAAGATGDIEIAAVCFTTVSSGVAVDSFTPAYTQDYEKLDNVNDRVGETDHRILTGATSDGCSWTTANTFWSCFACVLKAATGGGGGASIAPLVNAGLVNHGLVNAGLVN